MCACMSGSGGSTALTRAYIHEREQWNFPYNLNEIWDNQYGWLIKTLRKAVVVGEWGGRCVRLRCYPRHASTRPFTYSPTPP